MRIGYDTRVGHEARLAYGAFICDRVIIGGQARVAGFVCDGTSHDLIPTRLHVMGAAVNRAPSQATPNNRPTGMILSPHAHNLDVIVMPT